MRVVIRVDASRYMGSGHVMRCLTLAHALIQEGHLVKFICRDLPGNLIDKVRSDGFECNVLLFNASSYDVSGFADEYAFWLGVTQEQDAKQVLEIIGDSDWVIVDHYGLDAAWESRLRKAAKHILVIDDLANRPHDCDVLLDQNYYQDASSRYEGLLPNGCAQLLGPKYALIRSELVEAREQRLILGKFSKETLERIIIFMGGADKSNATSKILRAFPGEQVWRGCVDVVVGAINTHQDEVKSLCQDDKRFHFHCAPRNYVELMIQADLAIAAAGASTWERCCIGLPTLMFSIAHNQEEVASNIATLGAQNYMGRVGDYSSKALNQLFLDKLQNPKCFLPQQIQAKNLVDGKGAEYVLHHMV